MVPTGDSQVLERGSAARRRAAEALVHTGALAASVRALEPDFQMLAAQVKWALQAFEARFNRDEAYACEHYEIDRTATGAADLYDAVVDLAELLLECVAGNTEGRQHISGAD